MDNSKTDLDDTSQASVISSTDPSNRTPSQLTLSAGAPPKVKFCNIEPLPEATSFGFRSFYLWYDDEIIFLQCKLDRTDPITRFRFVGSKFARLHWFTKLANGTRSRNLSTSVSLFHIHLSKADVGVAILSTTLHSIFDTVNARPE